MAGTAEVLSLIDPIPNTDLSVLVPNAKGLDEVFRILSASISPDSAAKPPPPITEVAIFTATTDAFARANTNATVSESLARLEPVAHAARAKGLRVRGYVSVIITCPYSGRVDPRRVRDVSRELIQMGCYEVSLGDTTGTGTPASIRTVLEEVCKEIDPSRLAGHVSAHVLLRSCTSIDHVQRGLRSSTTRTERRLRTYLPRSMWVCVRSMLLSVDLADVLIPPGLPEMSLWKMSYMPSLASLSTVTSESHTRVSRYPPCSILY